MIKHIVLDDFVQGTQRFKFSLIHPEMSAKICVLLLRKSARNRKICMTLISRKERRERKVYRSR